MKFTRYRIQTKSHRIFSKKTLHKKKHPSSLTYNLQNNNERTLIKYHCSRINHHTHTTTKHSNNRTIDSDSNTIRSQSESNRRPNESSRRPTATRCFVDDKCECEQRVKFNIKFWIIILWYTTYKHKKNVKMWRFKMTIFTRHYEQQKFQRQ